MTISRVFLGPDPDNIVQVADALGSVDWVGADATHVYWTGDDGSSPKRLVRARRSTPSD